MPRSDQGGSDDFDDLIEIERASAVLHQRDPAQAERVVQALRARQAETAQREEAAARIQQAAVRKRRIRRLRLLIVGATVAAVAVLAVPLTLAIMKEARRADNLRKDLTAAVRPASKLGFIEAKDWLDVPSPGVVFEVPRNTCSALMGVGEGVTKPLRIRVERKGIDPIEVDGGIVWCSCDKEEAKAIFVSPPDKRVALRWLTSPMGTVGGIEVLMAEAIRGFSVTTDEPAFGCADAAFGTWSSGGRHGALAALDEAAKQKAAGPTAEGIAAIGMFDGANFFGVVASKRGYCYLALQGEQATQITLRTEQGRRVVERSEAAIGWCSYKTEHAYSLWRDKVGGASLLVFEVQAERVGGLTGLREVAARQGAKKMESLLESEDLTADATATLIASGVGQSSIAPADTTGLPGRANSTAVAFARFDSGSFLPDVAPSVPVACSPEPKPNIPLQTYVCVQARPQRWRSEGASDTQGAAEGRVPFWLSLLAGQSDLSALKAQAELLAFGRRMSLMGFEPTTTDGVKDSAFGGEVLGRPDKTEAVALGLVRRRPWVYALSDGAAWKLDGALQVMKIPMGKSVRVRVVGGALGGNPSDRRVVVWRR